VPVPIHHEQTAPRKPMFLQQTAPPVGDQARAAERERSGGEHEPAEPRRITPQELADVDTAPLPVGDPEAAVPEPVDEPEDEPEPLLGVTSEVARAPSLPEDQEADTMALPLDVPAAGRLRWLQGPLGWALLGAAVVGIGVPLAARCNAVDERPPAHSSRR
jgi:hypothetical protein